MTFREKFKYYKQKVPVPHFDDVLNFHSVDKKIEDVASARNMCGICSKDLFSLGLREPCEWRIFELKSKPGLIFICNPFSEAGQRRWIRKTLAEYTKKPSRLNLDVHGDLKENEDWWTVCCSKSNRSDALRRKLRWATLGYHHNWDTKKYSKESYSTFPPDLAELSETVILMVLGCKNYVAEAAIVNFYRMDSILSGHVDSSEENLEAPLISFSFGQSAIFLIGGRSLEDTPVAMFIRSGDIIIMSGPSRLCYHGVPRIVLNCFPSWGADEFDDREIVESAFSFSVKNFKEVDCENWINFKKYIREARINLNVRQVSLIPSNVVS